MNTMSYNYFVNILFREEEKGWELTNGTFPFTDDAFGSIFFFGPVNFPRIDPQKFKSTLIAFLKMKKEFNQEEF